MPVRENTPENFYSREDLLVLPTTLTCTVFPVHLPAFFERTQRVLQHLKETTDTPEIQASYTGIMFASQLVGGGATTAGTGGGPNASAFLPDGCDLDPDAMPGVPILPTIACRSNLPARACSKPRKRRKTRFM